MRVFHIIGQPGSGKTTLVAELVKELCKKKISVGTIKHSAHSYELDKPGKDSFVHRSAGASPSAMMTRDMAAVYLPRTPDMTPATLIECYYTHLDIVLIEGWISGPYDKIEVWRESVKGPFLFTSTNPTSINPASINPTSIKGVKALVTDDFLDTQKRQEADEKKIICLKRKAVSDIIALIIG
jgi:molybdopterin-guanine dinucleotide biosynthesis protein B